MIDYEVKCIICTDISKDGTLLGPNLQLYEHLQNEYAVNLIASGGVSSIADIRAPGGNEALRCDHRQGVL